MPGPIYRSTNSIVGGRGIRSPLVQFDPSALAFFAKGVALGQAPLSPTIKSAVNGLVTGLKAAGLWRGPLIMPLVGGTATWHSLNLIDPETFQATWSGTVTHNANGITGDGTTGYGSVDGAVFAYGSQTTNNFTAASYVRVLSSIFATELGTIDGASYLVFRSKALDNNDYGYGLIGNHGPMATSAIGLVALSCYPVNHEAFVNGSSIGTGSQPGGSTPTTPLIILGLAPAGQLSNANVALVLIADSFNVDEHAALYTIVQAFQTTLGRNV